MIVSFDDQNSGVITFYSMYYIMEGIFTTLDTNDVVLSGKGQLTLVQSQATAK